MARDGLDTEKGGALADSEGRPQFVVHTLHDPLLSTDIHSNDGPMDRDRRRQIVLRNPDGTPFGNPHSTGYENVVDDWGADKTGVLDSTVNFTLAAAAGSMFIPPGNYKINGVTTWPVEKDQIGAGAGVTILKLGPAGQIRLGARGTDSLFAGGQTSGFKVDGQGTQNVAGGGMYTGFCLKRKFTNLWITDCAGDGQVVETAQNCTWDSCQIVNNGRTNIVFDYGAGGHVFTNCEIANPARHAVEFRQTGLSLGGYPTFLGPSGNQFFGCIMEYGTPTSPYALVYQGAGTANQFFGCSVCPTGRTVVAPGITVEAAANAVSTTATITSGSANITVANPANIQGLMAGRVPGFPAGSIVASVVGNVVTMFGTASASFAAGTPVTFGAQSTPPTFDGLVSPGTSGFTYGVELKGNTGIVLTGKTVFTNHIAGLRTYSNDRVILDGPVDLFNTPAQWVAHTSDDTGATGQEYTVVRRRSNAGMDIVTPASASAKALGLRRADQANDHLSAYQGQVLLSDGTFAPVDTGIGYELDGDGLRYAKVFPQAKTAMLKVTGAPGATTDARYFGRFAAAGAPTGGTWRVGDWIIDANGTAWACVTAGTPGTWSAGARPTYAALSYPANAASLVLGDAAGSSIDTEHRVTLRGAITFTAGFAAGATLGTITTAHRTPSAVQVFHGAKYDSGGVITYAPVLVASTGAISSKIAFVSGDSLFIDGVNYHAA